MANLKKNKLAYYVSAEACKAFEGVHVDAGDITVMQVIEVLEKAARKEGKTMRYLESIDKVTIDKK